MFIPYSTDSPIYFFPYTTIGLILVNFAVFACMVTGDITGIESWLLQYGNGLHPLQWISSTFLHGGIGHVLGNMLFLWAFGLVVEGKLGWWRFLLVYLGISAAQGLLEQTIMLGYTGMAPGSLGASAVIYGIMAIAVVWAPKNIINCVILIFFRPFYFEVPILGMAAFYLFMQIAFIVIFSDASSWLHLSGFIVGFPLGIVLLKKKVIDCEGWDILHAFGDSAGKREGELSTKEIDEKIAKRKIASNEKQLAAARVQLADYLKNGNAKAAILLHEKTQHVGKGLALGPPDLLQMIKLLHAKKMWKESTPFMAELIQRSPKDTDPIRIKLAQICVMLLNRPGKAIELLQEVDLKQLSDKKQILVKQIATKARRLQSEGTVELDNEEW